MPPETPDPGNSIAAAINEAEEVQDPLDVLVERSKTDPGAAFETETSSSFMSCENVTPLLTSDCGLHSKKLMFAPLSSKNGSRRNLLKPASRLCLERH